MNNIKKIKYPLTKKVENSKGFSLVETLVAILILALAISVFMSVASGGLRSSFFARDRVAAFFLAQEAIEVIKNKRDENGIRHYTEFVVGGGSPVHWLDSIASWVGGPCGGPGQDCGIDSWNDQTSIASCAQQNGCVLKRNINGVFNHVDGSDTKFSRKVNMAQAGDDLNEAEITVTVTWGPALGNGELIVTEHIYNWHPLSAEEE